MKKDNFKNRYLIKVVSSIIIAVFNMIIQVILPRALSVEEYGFYTYNLNVFTSIVVMANLSTSNALISKYSKRNNEIGLVYFYMKYFAIITLILNVFIIVLYPIPFFQDMFAGQTLIVLLLGFEATIANKLLTDGISLYDACAISRFPACLQIVMKVIISLVIILGFLLGRLNLVYFYFVQFVVTIITAFILIICIIYNQKKCCAIEINLGTIQYIKEYFDFCKPLILATVVAQGVTIIMNWALMKWSGATEQAIFGVAWQLNSLVTYVFAPYAELSKREFAVLYNQEQELKTKFLQALKSMIWLTGYFAIFIAFSSEWILPIIYGDEYSGANIVTIIIMFYTVYQAWGQITGSYMIALEKTKSNAIISVVGQLLTLLFVFLFQVPNFIWPSSLGSIGIALNYLVTNIITTILAVCYISKSLKLSIVRVIAIQFPPIVVCSGLTIILKTIVNSLFDGYSLLVALIMKILVAGSIYTIIIFGIIYIHPSLLGITRKTMRRGIFKREGENTR